MRLLIVTAVPAEAEAIGRIDDALVLAGGIGRVNAAAATTEALVRRGPFDAVLSAGVGGALPGSDLAVGDTVVASQCVYVEEGIVTRHGFADLASIGLELGDFDGNTVPVDATLLDRLSEILPVGPIATVATCSGTDAAAQQVRDRTGAIVEAMEGAAVVHAARRLRTPGIEVRTVSNHTGDRERQGWDLAGALTALGAAMTQVTTHLRDLSAEPARG